MKTYQREFLDLSHRAGVLRFGEFTLKSGRLSPYFFFFLLFNTGGNLAKLGYYYAQAIQESAIDYDMVYGPAYKGIPLVSATAISLAVEHKLDIPYCFNRKEAKDHGEGGVTVGAPLQGKVLILDDVISAGTSVRESVEIIRAAGANPVGVVISLDRQERGSGSKSAVQEARGKMGLTVTSIVNLKHLILYLEEETKMGGVLKKVQAYRDKYGIEDIDD